MLSIKQLIDINSKASLILGGFFNILLVYLVVENTPKEMRFYSKIILQTCLYDLTNLIVADIVQPLLIIKDGRVFVIGFGIAGLLPHPWNNVMFYVWLYCAFAAMNTIVVQFAYRYLLLCKNYVISTCKYVLLNMVIAILLVILIGACLYITLGPANLTVDDPLLLDLLGHPDFVFKVIYMMPWVIWHVFFIGSIIISYLLVFIFGYQMVKFTREHLKNSEFVPLNLVELNRQLTNNLIFQACIPLLPFVGWIMCSYTCILGNMFESKGLNYLSLFAWPLQDWISVFNPIVTIIIVKPYRTIILKWLCRINQQAVSPAPNLQQQSIVPPIV